MRLDLIRIGLYLIVAGVTIPLAVYFDALRERTRDQTFMRRFLQALMFLQVGIGLYASSVLWFVITDDPIAQDWITLPLIVLAAAEFYFAYIVWDARR